MDFFVPNWFAYLFSTVSAVVTLFSFVNIVGGDQEEKEQGWKVLSAYWGGVVSLILMTVALAYFFKPLLNAIWNFIF